MNARKKLFIYDLNPFIVAVIALLLAAAGQYFLYTQKSLIAGLAFFLAASGLYIFSSRGNNPVKQGMGKRTEITLFSLIMLAAVFFRFYKINEIPAGCFVDEAQNVFDSMDIIRGNLPVYFGFSTHNAALFLYPTAFIFKLFGPGATQLRAVSAMFGVLTVPALYFLLRASLGARAAVIGGFILAVMRWHVNFSRIGYHASFALLVFVLVLYFVYKCRKEGSWRYYILLGVSLGISQNTYQSARLIPFWLVFAGFLVWLKDRDFFTRNAKKTAAAAFIALIISLPIIGYAFKNPAVFFQRQKEVGIFTKGVIEQTFEYKIKYKPGVLMLRNIKDTLLMFNYAGDKNPKHNISGMPGLDFILGIFVFLGFFRAVAGAAVPEFLFFLSVFAVFIVPGFITIEAPQSLRIFFLLPSIVFFAAIFLSDFLSLAEKAGADRVSNAVFKGAAACFVSALLLCSGINNYILYFKKQAENPMCWYNFATDAWVAGKYYREKGPGWKPIVSIDNYKERTFTLAAGIEGIRGAATRFKMDELVPAPFSGQVNYIYFLTPQYRSLVAGFFSVMYPGGKYVPFYNKYDPNWLVYYAYEVPALEAEKLNKFYAKNGLIFRRYGNDSWSGEPQSEKISPVVLLDPDYGRISDEWDGKIKITQKGAYKFVLDSLGYSGLFIDGKQVIECPGGEKGITPVPGTAILGAGFHTIKVRYSQDKTFAKMELRWAPPGKTEQLVPFNVLYH